MLGITPSHTDFTQANGQAIHVGTRWTRRIALTLTSTGAVVPLDGYAGEMEIADDYGGTEVVPVTVTIDGLNGVITLDILPADSAQITAAKGVYQLHLIDAGLDPEALFYGRVEIVPKAVAP